MSAPYDKNEISTQKNFPVQKKIIRKSNKLNQKNILSYHCLMTELTDMYKVALKDNNFAIALKSLEIKAKYLNFVTNDQDKKYKTLEEMNDEELTFLIGNLDKTKTKIES